MKTKRTLAIVTALIVITSAFSPAAFAVTYAPSSWSQWPTQQMGSGNYYTRFTQAIQRYCNNCDNAGLTMDGIYGQLTYNAVCVMQHSVGLTGSDITGIVNSKTWLYMRNKLYQYSSNANAIAYGIQNLNPNTNMDRCFLHDKNNLHWDVNTSTTTNVYTWTTIYY